MGTNPAKPRWIPRQSLLLGTGFSYSKPLNLPAEKYKKCKEKALSVAARGVFQSFKDRELCSSPHCCRRTPERSGAAEAANVNIIFGKRLILESKYMKEEEKQGIVS